MVVNKIRSRFTFALFIIPALLLYVFFAIVPLVGGFWLSTTNWDGTAPWTPAQMPIAEFENQILDKVQNPADRAVLTRYYFKDIGQGTYRKQELIGFDRYRVMMIINSTGYQNPDFRSVGLSNYLDIFTGRVDARFFPQRYQESSFQSGDSIGKAQVIDRHEFETNLLPHVKAASDVAYLKDRYRIEGDTYRLDPSKIASELDMQIALSQIKGLENDWEPLYNQVLTLGANGNTGSIDALMAKTPAIAKGKVSDVDLAKIRTIFGQSAEISHLKEVISQNWYIERQSMGVILFTVVFVVVNVLLVNILALLLAIGLDQKLKSSNALRSIFFIPNVLSMIIVAFIWQLVFSQLLPAITGVQQWMMNPDLAPWLTIFVATWQGVGYYTVIYLAGLQGVPQEIVESSSIDGARGTGLFFRIILPLLVPAITICLFLSLSGALKTFDIIFALYPSNSTSMGVDNITVNIFYDAFRDKHAGAATAKAILLLFTIMIISGTQLVVTKKQEVQM